MTALLDRVPASVVKVAPGLDHDRVPAGVEAEWVSVGGSIVEALLWGRGLVGHLAPGDARARRRGARADRGRRPRPGARRPGARRGCTSRTRRVIRSGLVALVAADLGATLVDPTIAYLTSDAPADSPWVQLLPGREVLPFNLKKLRALLRTRGIGRVVVKKRGLADRARDPRPGS